MMTYLNTFDWLIFSAIFFITLLVVVLFRKTPNRLEHLLMGRQLTLPLFVGTLVASWYGGILGVTQISFEHGIYNFLTQGLFWYGCYLLFAVVLVKKIHLHQAHSLPALFAQLYGERSNNVVASLIFIKMLPVGYLLSLAFILQWLFPISLNLAMLVGLGFIIIYSSYGGLRGVVVTDCVQFFVMFISVAAVIIGAYCNYGGYEFLTTHLPPSHFSLTGSFSWGYTLVWLWIAIAKTFINPVFYQRCIAAPSPQIASRGIIISVILWFFFDCCTTLGGLYARAVFADSAPQHAYLQLSMDVLPHGMRGFFIAGCIATILSTIDSYMLIAAHTLCFDWKILNTKLTMQQQHVISLILCAILCLWLAQYFQSLEQVWRLFGSLLTACLLWPYLCKLFLPWPLTDSQFVWSCLGGATALLADHAYQLVAYDSFYVGNLTCLLILILSYGVNLYRHHCEMKFAQL